MFTDIEGSTTLWEQHPDTMPHALARHDTILRSAIGRHSGYVFSTAGDGLAAAFARASDAVAAAVAAQQALTSETWPHPLQLRVRMGLHSGEADERNRDYLGRPLNRAARLMASASGGQIHVSETTAALAGRLSGIDYVDLGPQRMRGLAQPVRVLAAQADGLVPVARRGVVDRALDGLVPRPSTAWFGSTTEFKRLGAELLTRRLVTLTGPGGVGKTRLAVELACLEADQFPDGAWMVELASVVDERSAVAAVAATLSIRPQHDMTLVESIVDWLRGRRLLLVLDNCEHVLSPIADLARAVLDGSPEITILATSREPLRLSGERVIPISALATPDAFELFCDRATAADGSLVFSESDRAAVTAICQRLDGIPLAIELAAARTRSLALPELLDRLTTGFDLLRGGDRHGLVHHQTLRATMAWSYNLLNEAERALFNQASVFAGGFDLDAVEAVCGTGGVDISDIVDLLSSLINKSMIIADRTNKITRYRILEALREYGQERLEDRSETTTLRSWHLDHYVRVAQRAALIWPSPRQSDSDRVFERDWANVRAAHAWAITTADLAAADAIVASTWQHALSRMNYEHSEWADRNLQLASSTRPAGPATYGWASIWAFNDADFSRTIKLARQGIAAAAAPDHPDTCYCWAMLAFALLAQGKGHDAEEPAKCTEIAAAASADPDAEAWALTVLIESALSTDLAMVDRYVARLVALSDRVGSTSFRSRASFYQGQRNMQAVDPPDAAAALTSFQLGSHLAREGADIFLENLNLYGVVSATAQLQSASTPTVWHEVLTRFYDTRNWIGLWSLLTALASWLVSISRPDAAAVIYGHLEAHHRLQWDSRSIRRNRVENVRRVRQHPRSSEWLNHGAALDRDNLVAYVLEELAELRLGSSSDG